MKIQGLLNDIDIEAVRSGLAQNLPVDLGSLQDDLMKQLAELEIEVQRSRSMVYNPDEQRDRRVVFATGALLATRFGPSYVCVDRVGASLQDLYGALYPDMQVYPHGLYAHAAHCPISKKMDIGPVPHTDGSRLYQGIQAFYATEDPGVVFYEGGACHLPSIRSVFDQNLRSGFGGKEQATRGVIDWFERESGLTPHRTNGRRLILANNGVVHAAPWFYHDNPPVHERRNVFSFAVVGGPK